MFELKAPKIEVEASLVGRTSLFLGGGISHCPPWQNLMVDLLKDTELVLFNPRRDDFDTSDASMTEQQIQWEHKYLKLATARMFWFPNETLCPITLFELGKYLLSGDPLFVGCDPKYQRKIDLEIQISLELSNHEMSYSLKDISEKIILWYENY